MKKIISVGIMFIIVLLGLYNTSAIEMDYDCCSLIKLPSDFVTMVIGPGTDSHFIMTLSNVPPGYDVSNGDYPAWCNQRGVKMSYGVLRCITFYCSYDPNLPEVWQDDDWDKVNYVINHKHGEMMDVQEAIWYFTGDRPAEGPLAKEMIEEANRSGEGFCPKPGEAMIVIVDSGQNLSPVVQRSIIEVTVPIEGDNGGVNPPNDENSRRGNKPSSIKPNKPPIPDLSVGEPYIGFIDENITFNASHSWDPDDYIISWSWDFDDGSIDEGEIINHSYSSSGKYTVVLTVRDMKGSTSKANTTAIIIHPNRPPSNPEIIGPSKGFIDNEYSFNIVSTDNDNDKIKYTIDWGDRTLNVSDFLPAGIKFNITHIWKESGNYTVNVTADDNLTILTDEFAITIDEPKEPNVPEESNIALVIILILVLLLLILFLILAKRQKKKKEKTKEEK